MFRRMHRWARLCSLLLFVGLLHANDAHRLVLHAADTAPDCTVPAGQRLARILPPGIDAVFVQRGRGHCRLVNGGWSFHENGQQGSHTAYYQFSGPGVGRLFELRAPGEVRLRWTSVHSLAARQALPQLTGNRHVFRTALEAHDGAGRRLISLVNTIHGNRFHWIVNFAGGSEWVPLSDADADRIFGRNVTAELHLTWDGRGRYEFSVNGQRLFARSYNANQKFVWDERASLSIGAQDRQNYGGFFASDDAVNSLIVQGAPLPPDESAPSVSLLSPSAGTAVSGTVSWYGRARDNDAVLTMELLIDGQPVAPPTPGADLRVAVDTRRYSAGEHTVILRARDPSGNTGEAAVNVQFIAPESIDDREPPQPVTLLSSRALPGGNVRLDWYSALDNVGASGYRILRDGQPVAELHTSSLGPIDWWDTDRPAGTFTYQVVAFDQAGHLSPASAPVTVEIPRGFVLTAGPGQQFRTPCAAIAAARPGDIVEIDAAGSPYTGDVCVVNKDRLTIRGVNGRPHIPAAGRFVQGKAIWVVTGRDVTIENVELSGAAVPDRNGAAIRSEGRNLTLRHVYFHHNENGLLSMRDQGGQILIEHSEFAYNGRGDGYTHNIYVNNLDRLIVRYTHSHHCRRGHLIKSRARENYITYNRLTDEEGTASYELSFPNGGLAIVAGNLIQQSATTGNDSLVEYGSEGLMRDYPTQLVVAHNTLVNNHHRGAFYFNSIRNGDFRWLNNLLVGPGEMRGAVQQRGNVRLEGDPFVNSALFDYRLRAGVLPDIPTESVQLPDGPLFQPEFEYIHPRSGATRARKDQPTPGAYSLP